MYTTKANSVENSKTVLDAITHEEEIGLIRNRGKAQFRDITVERTYKSWNKDGDTYIRKVPGEEPIPVAEIDEDGESRKTIRPILDAPPGAHFFRKVYDDVDTHRAEEWRSYNGPERVDKPNPAVGFGMHLTENAFIKAAMLAYCEHLPLRFSANHVLVCMLNAVGHWMEIERREKGPKDRYMNFIGTIEKFGEKGWERDRFEPLGKVDVEIDFETPNPGEEDIDEAIDKMLDPIMTHMFEPIRNQLAKMMKDMPIDVKRTLTLTLSAASSYTMNFRYNCSCGLPSITLLGEREEWANLSDLMDLFTIHSHGELTPWAKVFKPAIQVILDTIDGKDMSERWANFINFNDQCSMHTVSGWINAFFPFIKGIHHVDYEYCRPPIRRDCHLIVRNEAVFERTNAFEKMNAPSYGCVTYTEEFIKDVKIEDLSELELDLYRCALRNVEEYTQKMAVWKSNKEEREILEAKLAQLEAEYEALKKEKEPMTRREWSDDPELNAFRYDMNEIRDKVGRKPSEGIGGSFKHASLTNLNRFATTATRKEYEWNDLGTTRTLVATSGLISVIQWDDDCALEPFMGYQIDEILAKE